MSAAAHVDPVYAETLELAKKSGVEMLAYRASPIPEMIELDKKISVKV